MNAGIGEFLYFVTSLDELREYFADSNFPIIEYKNVYIVVNFCSAPMDEYYGIYLYTKRCKTVDTTFITNIAYFEYHGDDFLQDGYDFDKDCDEETIYIYNYAKNFIDNIK